MVWVAMVESAGRPRCLISTLLEADLVNDVEPDQRCKRKRDPNGEQVHVEGESVGSVWVYRLVVVAGCHKTPWCGFCLG